MCSKETLTQIFKIWPRKKLFIPYCFYYSVKKGENWHVGPEWKKQQHELRFSKLDLETSFRTNLFFNRLHTCNCNYIWKKYYFGQNWVSRSNVENLELMPSLSNTLFWSYMPILIFLDWIFEIIRGEKHFAWAVS